MNTLDQLVEDAAEAKGFDMNEHDRTTAASDKPISKSSRVRDYMKRFPEARNVDIAEALEIYGVTPPDVANVKAQLKKKAEKKKAKAKPVAKAAAASSKPEAEAKPKAEVDATIQLDLLEAGVEFIRKAGGINEALHILGVVRRIRSL